MIMACQYRSQVWVTGWCEVACRYCAPDYESTCKYNETNEDCDKYGTDLCKKMNDPDFVEFMKERDKE